MRASPAPPSLPPTSPTFAVKACLSFYEDNAPLPLPFLRRVQCGRMEVGLSAIKTSLLFPPSMRWRGGGSGLKGRVPRQRLPQQWRRQGRHVTFLIGAGDAQQHTRS